MGHSCYHCTTVQCIWEDSNLQPLRCRRSHLTVDVTDAKAFLGRFGLPSSVMHHMLRGQGHYRNIVSLDGLGPSTSRLRGVYSTIELQGDWAGKNQKVYLLQKPCPSKKEVNILARKGLAKSCSSELNRPIRILQILLLPIELSNVRASREFRNLDILLGGQAFYF